MGSHALQGNTSDIRWRVRPPRWEPDSMDLTPIETYYDAVPRVAATTEEVGPFTLFRAAPSIGWQFYARPRLGLAHTFSADEVGAVLARQQELGVPQTIEWVDDVTPSLLPAVREAVPEFSVAECPLLVLPVSAPAAADGPGKYVALPPDSPDLGWVSGAQNAAFGEAAEVTETDEGKLARRRELIADGTLVVVAAYDESGRVIGGGTAAPRGDTSELMGIATIPAARRQGHGAAITAALVAAVRDRGVHQVFLAAASDDAASIYRAVGFERVGTSCILEPGDG